jgi:hypothetical protein
MGVPLCLHVLSGDVGERVVYGDSEVGGGPGDNPNWKLAQSWSLRQLRQSIHSHSSSEPGRISCSTRRAAASWPCHQARSITTLL